MLYESIKTIRKAGVGGWVGGTDDKEVNDMPGQSKGLNN